MAFWRVSEYLWIICVLLQAVKTLLQLNHLHVSHCHQAPLRLARVQSCQPMTQRMKYDVEYTSLDPILIWSYHEVAISLRLMQREYYESFHTVLHFLSSCISCIHSWENKDSYKVYTNFSTRVMILTKQNLKETEMTPKDVSVQSCKQINS